MMPQLKSKATAPIDTNETHSMALWPMMVSIGVAFMLIIAAALPSGGFFVLLPLLLLIVIIAGLSTVTALWMLISSARRGEWRATSSYSILPLVVLLIALQPSALFSIGAQAGDIVHFRLYRADYMSEIQAMPASDTPRLKLFSWGGTMWASDGVVYDESDEIARPTAEQSTSWKERAARTDLSCNGYFARPMGKHFYVVHYPC